VGPPKHPARHGNHPVDTVNWYEAAAFCHWLNALWNSEVRLPTEYEWQRAATGGDPGRTYPWGAEWDAQAEPWRANTVESGLGRPTAVGMYPAGASATGIEDMASTLWEWCWNAFDNPDNDGFPQSLEDYRALRGGSWYYNQVLARSADRGRGYPYGRDYNIGFGWCVRPQLRALSTESAAQAALSSRFSIRSSNVSQPMLLTIHLKCA
jgi:formylglycine-generating enzyme required for sulfatase activity